ncbi:MAG: hypothetical protein LBG26_00980 [Treponema sp.]|jgi:hypothetical protein|nr:hypothetical protein [Treponema sp.]
MWFKTKKKVAKDPFMSPASRAPRYNSVARVRINGFEGEAVLRNASIGGFCMKSRTYAAIQTGERYTIWIQPERSANISAFELKVEVRWTQSSETSFSSGFLIVSAPANNHYEKYIDHVKITFSEKKGIPA